METKLSHRELKDLAIGIRRRVAAGELISLLIDEVISTHGMVNWNKIAEIIDFQETNDLDLATSAICQRTKSLKAAMMYICQMCLAVTAKVTVAELCISSVLATYAQRNGYRETMDKYLEFLDEMIFDEPGKLLGYRLSAYAAADFRQALIRLLQVNPARVVGRWPVFDDADFLNCFHPDEFWEEKVSRYINSGDLERAWDELRRANRGLFLPGFKQNSFDPVHRGYFWATEGTIQSLVNYLYNEVRKQDVNLPEIVNSVRAHRWRRVKSYSNRFTLVSGFDIAYFSCCPTHEEEMEIIESECFVRAEGHKALLLGDYFLKKRNLRRRARNERRQA